MRIAGSVLCWALSRADEAVSSTAMAIATKPMYNPRVVLMFPLLLSLAPTAFGDLHED
jgi:hypothetical protein